MTTVSEANRRSSARSFAGLVRRAPLAVAFSKLPDVELAGSSEGISVQSVPGKNGIDDGFRGTVRVPWYAYDWEAGTYYDPFGTVTPDQIEKGTCTVDGKEYSILNVSLNSLKTILSVKLGGLADG